MNSILRKYPKWTWEDDDIRPLIEREIEIYKKNIQNLTVSSNRAESALQGMARLSKEIKTLIKKKGNENSTR
jgi:hypothetical protein